MHSKLQQCSRLAVSSPSPQQKDIERLADLHFLGDWTNSSLLHFLAFPLSPVPLLGVAFDFHRLRQSRSLEKSNQWAEDWIRRKSMQDDANQEAYGFSGYFATHFSISNESKSKLPRPYWKMNKVCMQRYQYRLLIG